MSESTDVIAAFTTDQAVRLTKVSARQLRYWAADGFYVPSLDSALHGMRDRLYSFRDLVCLRVINALRNECRVPLQHLREVKANLSHLGDDVWARTTLYVLARRVIIRNPETGSQEDAVSGQGVLQIPLEIVSGEMREAVRALRARAEADYGRIDTKRFGANRAVVAGTRIPVSTIHDFASEGLSAAEIVLQYPSLTEADVDAALRHELAA